MPRCKPSGKNISVSHRINVQLIDTATPRASSPRPSKRAWVTFNLIFRKCAKVAFIPVRSKKDCGVNVLCILRSPKCAEGVQGVSTRKVSAIIEALCGSAVSSTQVSRASKLLDEVLEQWRDRPLGECRYLFLDARYEKIRDNGQIRDVAVLIAAGLTPNGKRQIVGVSVSLSEHEVHWRTFLQQLVARGLCGVQLIISDAHEGLKAARQAIFGGVLWQRCQFHLQQNAQAYVPRQELRAEVAADIRTIFNAPDRPTAENYLTRTLQKYSKSAPRLTTWLESNLPEGFTIFGFPKSHQRRLRTVNVLERANREIERRTRVVSIFPNESSCLRLISALLMELDESWQMGRIYLNLDEGTVNSSS